MDGLAFLGGQSQIRKLVESFELGLRADECLRFVEVRHNLLQPVHREKQAIDMS